LEGVLSGLGRVRPTARADVQAPGRRPERPSAKAELAAEARAQAENTQLVELAAPAIRGRQTQPDPESIH
jgi:hypothetical protein